MKKVIISGVLYSFLSLFLLTAFDAQAQTQKEEERVYVKIEVKGLACPYCAYGMEKELKKISGVDNVEIELKAGLAFISTPVSQKPEEKELTQVIADAGFTPGKIEFSSKPFPRKKKK